MHCDLFGWLFSSSHAYITATIGHKCHSGGVEYIVVMMMTSTIITLHIINMYVCVFESVYVCGVCVLRGGGGHLGQQGCHGIVAEVQALDDAGSNGQHILEGATNLDTGDIGGGVDTQIWPRNQLLHLFRQFRILLAKSRVYMRVITYVPTPPTLRWHAA